jgi:hypothetical protein
MAWLSLVGQSEMASRSRLLLFLLRSRSRLREDFVVFDQIRIAGFCREIRWVRL